MTIDRATEEVHEAFTALNSSMWDAINTASEILSLWIKEYELVSMFENMDELVEC